MPGVLTEQCIFIASIIFNCSSVLWRPPTEREQLYTLGTDNVYMGASNRTSIKSVWQNPNIYGSEK